MHAIWLCRNRVYFDDEVWGRPRILGYCLAHLRRRVKVDLCRLSAVDFDTAWGRHGVFVKDGPSGLVVCAAVAGRAVRSAQQQRFNIIVPPPGER